MAAYRDEAASLEERHRQLRRALEETRARSSALTNEEARIHEELAALHRELEVSARATAGKRSLPLANTLIATPCDVPWDSMVGDTRIRHCGECKMSVHNLSAMTQDEVHAFLEAMSAQAQTPGSGPLPCINLWQRADGTIITADCPVGIRRRRLRAFLAASLGVGVASLIAATALAVMSVSNHPPPPKEKTTYEPISTVLQPPVYGESNGYISVDGAKGLRVYDDNGFVGMTPVMYSAKPGTHSLRVEDTEPGGKTQFLSTYVQPRNVAHIVIDRAAPTPIPVQPVMRTGGVPMPHPRGALK